MIDTVIITGATNVADLMGQPVRTASDVRSSRSLPVGRLAACRSGECCMQEHDLFALFPYQAIVDRPPVVRPNGSGLSSGGSQTLSISTLRSAIRRRTSGTIRGATTAIALDEDDGEEQRAT
jgi:hypothetical protein